MPRRAAAFILLALLHLTLTPVEAQDKKGPVRKSAELETEHWQILAVALPSKDFDQMLEQYYRVWQRKVGPDKSPSGKLKLKLHTDREEFNSQPGRSGGYAIKDDGLHVLMDNAALPSVATGGPRAYLTSAYPGPAKRTDLPAWAFAGLSSYLGSAVWKEGQVEIDSLKHPQSTQYPLSIQSLMKSSDWRAFDKSFKADSRDYETHRRVIEL